MSSRQARLIWLVFRPLIEFHRHLLLGRGLTGAGSRSGIAMPAQVHAGNDQDGGFTPDFSGSIVGLWHVVYTAGGSVFNETFDQWHIDGTEFEKCLAAAGYRKHLLWRVEADRGANSTPGSHRMDVHSRQHTSDRQRDFHSRRDQHALSRRQKLYRHLHLQDLRQYRCPSPAWK